VRAVTAAPPFPPPPPSDSDRSDAPRPTLAVREIPDPVVGPGEVLVRTTHLLVTPAECTDLLVPGARRVCVPGAWGVGVVERLGAGVDGATFRDARVAPCQTLVCGGCDHCRAGLAQHCQQRRVLGTDVDGLWAQKCVVPASCVAPLTRGVGVGVGVGGGGGMDDEAACFANPLALVLHASRHVAIARKPFVTILGDGPHALLAAMLLSTQNASVRLLSESDLTLAIADRCRIKHRAVRDAGLRADQDVLLDATDGAWAQELAPGLLRPRGAWVILACHQSATPRAFAPETRANIMRHELTVHGVTQPGPALLSDALSLLHSGGLDTTPLVSLRTGLWDVAGVLGGRVGSGASHAPRSAPPMPVLLRA
jgi:alcohol dehydrogenase